MLQYVEVQRSLFFTFPVHLSISVALCLLRACARVLSYTHARAPSREVALSFPVSPYVYWHTHTHTHAHTHTHTHAYLYHPLTLPVPLSLARSQILQKSKAVSAEHNQHAAPTFLNPTHENLNYRPQTLNPKEKSTKSLEQSAQPARDTYLPTLALYHTHTHSLSLSLFTHTHPPYTPIRQKVLSNQHNQHATPAISLSLSLSLSRSLSFSHLLFLSLSRLLAFPLSPSYTPTHTHALNAHPPKVFSHGHNQHPNPSFASSRIRSWTRRTQVPLSLTPSRARAHTQTDSVLRSRVLSRSLCLFLSVVLHQLSDWHQKKPSEVSSMAISYSKLNSEPIF